MKIIHVSDLHIGQILYQNYDRVDEHRHFMRQLSEWCDCEQPDALVVSGDIFDIQQPSAAVWRFFTEEFVALHRRVPSMRIIITAGNHDSASRLAAQRDVWQLASVDIVAHAPAMNYKDLPIGWEDDYIIQLPTGYILPLPFMAGERSDVVRHLLDVVAERNTSARPVVLMAHMAVSGCDITGHDFDIGNLRTQNLDNLGSGYDYLALGHIHRPQTLRHEADREADAATYPAPVARYCGSALHVSADEAYPHTVSVVEIDHHHGTVELRQLRIDQLRHFHTLPLPGSPAIEDAPGALAALRDFCANHDGAYVRLRIDRSVNLPPEFNQLVYDLIADCGRDIRYNPKIVWTGQDPDADLTMQQPEFEVAELQQMRDPLQFVERTLHQYPELDLQELRDAFQEIEEEVRRLDTGK